MSIKSQKNQLRTVRFTAEEAQRIENYLKQNPIFDSFSSLARVATLTFLGQQGRFHLEPVAEPGSRHHGPRFLWDYDLSDQQVRQLLGQPGLSDIKRFLMERIISECRFEEVFDYLGLDELKRHLSRLTLPAQKRRHWQYALDRWSSHD